MDAKGVKIHKMGNFYTHDTNRNDFFSDREEVEAEAVKIFELNRQNFIFIPYNFTGQTNVVETRHDYNREKIRGNIFVFLHSYA